MSQVSPARRRRRTLGTMAGALVGVVTVVAPLAAGSRAASRVGERTAARPRAAVTFEANAGQTDPQVRLRARGPGYTMFLGDRAATLALNGVARPLTLSFAGASRTAAVRGDRPQAATTYFVQRGTHDLLSAPRFEGARYAGLYPGVDAIFHGDGDRIRFDFEVAAGVDPGAISLSFGGADAVRVGPDGELVVGIGAAGVRLNRPFIYQDIDGARRPVRGGFVLRDGRVGFHVGGYDRSRPLVIDPTIEYATYLGSPGDERIVSVAANAAGEAYVFGATTDRLDFPTTSTFGRLTSVGEYCFVSKFDASGSNLLYSVVYLDSASVSGSPVLCDAMALAPTGRIQTVFQSVDGSFVKTLRTLDDSVTPLTSSSVLLPALEGFRPVEAVAGDADGNIFVVGACFNGRVQTPSPYPYPGGYRTTPSPGRCVTQDNFFSPGQSETVLVEYDTLGHLQYGTFLTTPPDDDPSALALALGSDGLVYVGGRTSSQQLPTRYDAYGLTCRSDATAAGCDDAFLVVIDPVQVDRDSLVFAGYFGGSGIDAITDIAVDAQGRITVVGETTSPDLPGRAGPLDGSGGATFLARFDLSQSGSDQLIASTILAAGQAFQGMPPHLAVATDGSVSVVGMWAAAPFPAVSGLLDATPSASQPLPFLTTFAPDASSIQFSTLLGATASHDPRVVSLTADAVLAAVVTSEADRATAGAFRAAPGGGNDLLLMKISGVSGINHPPTVSDLPLVERGADTLAGATVTLFVAASDPDSDPLTVTFTGPFGAVPSTYGSGDSYGASLPFPIGVSSVTATVTDGRGGVASSSAIVTIVGAVTGGAGTVVVHPPALLDVGEPLPLFSPPVTLTIEHATGPGVTTMVIRTDVATPAVPDGLQLPSPPYYYQLHSTVAAAGPYTICLDTTGMSVGDRPSLRLYFNDGSAWHDISGPSAGATFCGQTATLNGTFALMTQAAAWNVATTIVGPTDPATGQSLGLFGGTAIDPVRGSIYVTAYAALNRVDLATGAVARVAGDGANGVFQYDSDGSYGIPSPSGVPATTVHLTNPHQIALDAAGNVYVAEFCQVRKVGTDGTITNIAGDGFCRSRGDGGPAAAASLNGTYGLALDAAGGVLVSEFTGRIRRIDAAGLISTVAGNGTAAVVPGPALQSGFGGVTRIAVAPNGDVYLAAQGTQLLRISAGAGGTLDGGSQLSVVNTCALTACTPQPFGGDGGPVAAAAFQLIESVGVAANGDVLVGDYRDARVRRIAAGADHVVTGLDADEVVTTVAGFNPATTVSGQNAGQAYYEQGENFGLSSAAIQVIDVLPDGDGFFYVTAGLDQVRHVGPTDVVSVSGADLSVSANVSPDPATAGSALIYAAAVRNLGPDQADAVSFTLNLSPAAVFQGATGILSCTPATGVVTTVVVCDVGSVPAGGVAQVAIAVVPPLDGTSNAQISVSTSTRDPESSNNSVSLATTVNRPKSPSATDVVSSPRPSVVGQSVTFTATVTGAAPTGTVTFTDNGSAIGAPAVLSGGSASLTTSALAVGSHAIAASYGGDANNLASVSSPLVQIVGGAVTTTTAVTSTPNPSRAGQSVTLTAQVTGVGPTGTVTFVDGTATLGTATLSTGSASLTTNTLTAGSHGITASYSGDVSNLASASSALAQTVAPAYTVTDLGNLGGGDSSGFAVNNNGQVTGESSTADSGVGYYYTHAFVVSAPYTRMIDLGTLGTDGTSAGWALNAFGQVVGTSSVVSGNGSKAFLNSPPYLGMFDLGDLGRFGAAALGINDAGYVTGEADAPDSDGRAFMWDGTMHDLGSLAGPGGNSAGLAINASGQVTGASATSNGVQSAFLYTPSTATMVDLGDLGGGGSEGTALNAAGHVTGSANVATTFREHAVLWNGTIHDLGTLAGGQYSVGYGINASDQIVGESDSTFGARPFLYTPANGMVDVNTLIASGTGWGVNYVYGINDAGQIAGEATRVTCGASSCVIVNHAILLTPPPPPMGAVVTGAAVAKPPSATAAAVFAVTFFNPGSQPVEIDFSGVDGSAHAGADYAATSGALTFAPGVTTQFVTVPVLGGPANLSARTFSLALTNPSTNTVVASATGTILVPARPPIVYTVSASPASLSVVTASDASSAITLRSQNGISESAHIAAAWYGVAPNDVTFTLVPSQVTIPSLASGSALTTLTVTASASASLGTFDLRVTAASASGVQKVIDVPVVIASAPPPTGCCVSAGAFVDPLPGVAPAVTPDAQDPNVGYSSKGTYQVVVSSAAPGGLATIEVQRGSTRLLTTQATQWGFSPDEDRFVAWSTQTANTGTINLVTLYDLTRASPQIWSNDPSTVSSRILFSPSGRYLFTTAVVGGPQIQIILVDAHSGRVEYSDSPRLVSGAPVEGQDGFGTIGWGFGPNDTRFVYAYLTGATGVSWNLVNLEKGPGHALVRNLPLNNETADYWQFSKCAEVIAIVRQPGQQYVYVDLLNTADGSSAGNEVQIARPVQTLDLTTTATAHVVIVNHDTTHPLTLGSLIPDCAMTWPTTSPTSPTTPSPTSTCCMSSGPFVDPAPGVAPAVTIDAQDPNLGYSSKGTYQVVVSPAAPGGLATIVVNRGSTHLLTTQATQWGFSPDEDRFVAWSTQTGGTVTVNNVALYDLTRSNPQGAIWSDSPSTVSSRILFSPSGRYLFYSAVVSGPQTRLTLVNAHTGGVAFSDSPPLMAAGPSEGQDAFGTIGWGFGPDDSRFVYGYLTGPTNVAWNLVNLGNGSGAALVKNLAFNNETAVYWQFAACGEVIAVVQQPGQSFFFVDLFSTKDGSPVGREVQIAAPVQTLDLTATATAYAAIVNHDAANPVALGALATDCSLSVTAFSPVDLLLIDAQGRRTGFDPVTNTVVSEIPGTSFTGIGTEPETITVPLVTGTYIVEATGVVSLTDAEPFRLRIATTTDSDLSDAHDITGMATAGSRQQFTFTVDNLTITSVSSTSPSPPTDVSPPVISASVSGTPGSNGWYTSNVAVSWTVTDAESAIRSSTGCTPQSVSDDTAGVTFTCTATSAGGTASSSVTVKVDRTPPTLTFGAPTPPQNAAGWNNTDVSMAFVVSDNLSGVASTSIPSPLVLAAGAGRTGRVSVTDGAGNVATFTSPPVNIDTAPPTIVGVAAPAANVNGWNRTAVTVSFRCADALSGLSPGSPPAPVTLSANGAAQSAAGTCLDLAGNSAATTVSPINIDLIAPAVTAPPNQVVQQTSAAGASVTYPPPAIVETGSGIRSSNCSPASGSVFAIGTTTVTCTATDRADNVGSASFTVTVNPATVATDGAMYGVGFVAQGEGHEHFVFGVTRVGNRSGGRFEYWVNAPRRCGSDDEYTSDPGFDGSHDNDFGRGHHDPSNRFEASSITSVVFSDDAAFQPGRGSTPTVDTVRFSGSGKWNGRGGYTFEVVATDRGEPGRHTDTFSLRVKDAGGTIVVDVSGTLDGGNIESTRLRLRK